MPGGVFVGAGAMLGTAGRKSFCDARTCFAESAGQTVKLVVKRNKRRNSLVKFSFRGNNIVLTTFLWFLS